ncbi:MAG: TraB/GumN family protein [Candidatus Aenigmarchaeota archaeon]|nr:TraB/GumN family protein [Candidatus Aenigmarchaeota archaeon]
MTITIIGTSHIAHESIEKIKKAIEEKAPDCVAVELDMDRLYALKNKLDNKEKKKSYIDRQNIIQSMIINLLMKLQNKLSEQTGLGAGEEMLFAVNEATNRGVPVKLIDQHINITISNIGNISIFERIKLLGYLVFVAVSLPFLPFLSVFSKKTIDLNKVPEKEMILEMMGEFKKKFPQTFDVLVEDRNKIMAEKIKKLGGVYENIVVVVGAGHIEGMRAILKGKIAYDKSKEQV